MNGPEANHEQVSGGLPHSEIHGSKPVLGSPWLIAEYHVLHRLLLPRHPPNALLALDPTQRRQGTSHARRHARQSGPFASPLTSATPMLAHGSLVGSHTFPIPHPPMQGRPGHSVSVLDLEQNRRGSLTLSGPAPRSHPHTGRPAVLMFLSLNDVTCRLTWIRRVSAVHGAGRCDPMKARQRALVEPVGIEPTTPCLQSRRSPI
jgi:hypothetical protein